MSDRVVTQGTLQEAGGNSTRDGLEGRSPPEVPYGTQVADQSAGGIPTEPADRASAAPAAEEAGVANLSPGAAVPPSQVRETEEQAAAGADPQAEPEASAPWLSVEEAAAGADPQEEPIRVPRLPGRTKQRRLVRKAEDPKKQPWIGPEQRLFLLSFHLDWGCERFTRQTSRP